MAAPFASAAQAHAFIGGSPPCSWTSGDSARLRRGAGRGDLGVIVKLVIGIRVASTTRAVLAQHRGDQHDSRR